MKLSPVLLVSALLAFFVATLLANVLLTKHLLNASKISGPQIVTVDAAEALMWFARSRPDGVSDEEWAEQVVSLNKSIGPAVDQMSAENGVVVLNSAAVLTGAPNYTPQLMAILVGKGGAE